MLRITGGFLGGRRIMAPPGSGLRPTQQRVREALFSMLAERIPNCHFLDLFAGSGVVGVEAWSRGAAAVTLVERDRRRGTAMRALATTLAGPDEPPPPLRVVIAEVSQFLRRVATDSPMKVDVVFADPPYADGDDGAWERRLGGLLAAAGLPRAGGIWILEWRSRNRPSPPPPWRVLDDRDYGETRLTTYGNA